MNRFRYDFFTIWSSGFPYIDNILQLLRQEEYLNILRIEKLQVFDMQKFIFDLYACDHVPLAHLQSKLSYLFKLSPEIINIFVENHNPQEISSGQGTFQKVQCQYIVSLKNKLRNLYNPKHDNPEFERAPLSKGVSHEHIVHASDAEEQVDYYLKLLGFSQGIHLFYENNLGLPFEKPYHIPRPKQYCYKKINIDLLRASILTTSDKDIFHELRVIEMTPHFLSFQTKSNDYRNYINKYRFTYLLDDHFPEKLESLKKLSRSEADSLPEIIVRQENDHFRILDGVHRAALQKYLGYTDINCIVVEN